MIDATVAGTDSNSYVTLAEALAYAADTFSSDAFLAMSSSDQEKALRVATREIDRLRFQGFEATAGQRLKFPRQFPYSSDFPALTTSLEIPQAVKDAQCEQAFHVAANAATGGKSRRQQLQAEGVTSFRVGNAQESYRSASSADDLCPEARRLLKYWITITGRIIVDGREQEDILGDEIQQP